MVSTDRGPRGALPRLAVRYHPQAVAPLRVIAKGQGSWRTIWVVDRAVAGTDSSLQLLRRLGEVVDVTGKGPGDAARALAELAPDGIVALSDDQLESTALVAAEMGLPFHTAETALRLNDKSAQRAALQAAGIPVPGNRAVRIPCGESLLRDVLDSVRFPAVLKPQSGAASRDTYRVADSSALREALHAVEERSGGADVDLIIEEYLPDGWPRRARPVADYVSVESVAGVDGICPVAVTGKLPLAEAFRETGNFVPSTLQEPLLAQVLDLAERAVRALGVRVGGLHTEIKLTSAGPRVIEVNGRLGGGGIPVAVERATGCSLLRAVADAAFGRPVSAGGPLPAEGVAFSFFVQPPTSARALASVAGLTEASQVTGVRDITLNRRPGDLLDWRDGSQSYVVAVHGLAASHDHVQDIIGRVRRTLRVVYA